MPLASKERVGGDPDSVAIGRDSVMPKVAIRSRFGRDWSRFGHAEGRDSVMPKVAIGRDWSRFGHAEGRDSVVPKVAIFHTSARRDSVMPKVAIFHTSARVAIRSISSNTRQACTHAEDKPAPMPKTDRKSVV